MSSEGTVARGGIAVNGDATGTETGTGLRVGTKKKTGGRIAIVKGGDQEIVTGIVIGTIETIVTGTDVAMMTVVIATETARTIAVGAMPTTADGTTATRVVVAPPRA